MHSPFLTLLGWLERDMENRGRRRRTGGGEQGEEKENRGRSRGAEGGEGASAMRQLLPQAGSFDSWKVCNTS